MTKIDFASRTTVILLLGAGVALLTLVCVMRYVDKYDRERGYGRTLKEIKDLDEKPEQTK